MRKIFLFLLPGLLLSCKNDSTSNYQSPKDVSIQLEPLSTDTLSVRALDVKDGTFWFAGNRSTYGSFHDTLGSIQKGRVVYNGNDQLEFRSIAVTADYTFILTAGNPALIYRISHQNDSLALVYEESGEKVFYDSMKFWNDMDGIAMGDPQEDCFTVLTTTDGGDTWSKITCDKLPTIVEGEAAYAASNSNIALQGEHIWIATGGQAARVLYSPDHGKSWEVQETPMTSGGEMTGIYALDFYDENLGVMIGGDWNAKDNKIANKAITRDGGKTWKLIADGNGPGYCSDIAFVPQTGGNELIAVGSPGIWWSGNQGQDWKQLSTTGFYTIAMTNDQKGLLAGNNQISRFELYRK
ncbi:sialidase family protein [Nonlabens agnitus]|uniref:Oxidoreductase n=1 Tax=Nonlabens agnitus TaxID=870484 RepID=A0A2S9WSY5_9FLAO|nr:oxidoreductase [Nonlabens agnitus]PRP66406.1 oxidoreductase [Nonlabens agnitus]